MTDTAKIRLHLAIFTAYSWLFVFFAVPYLLGIEVPLSFGFGLVSWLPSVIYLFLANSLLSFGRRAPWQFHIRYLVVVVPITLLWMYLLGVLLPGVFLVVSMFAGA
mgnify:CR=1 FL=1